MYGIPNMKLDKDRVVLPRIRQMEARASLLSRTAEVGVNFPAEKLLKEFDAAVLCTGATKPRDLPIEGATSKAPFAMDSSPTILAASRSPQERQFHLR